MWARAGVEIRTQVWFAPSLAEIPVAKVNDYTYHLDRKLPVISRALFLFYGMNRFTGCALVGDGC